MPGRVTLLHGFTQTGRSWRPLTTGLRAAGFELCTPDLPGHGSRTDVRADLWAAARLALADGGQSAYVGYSMGGRVALHAALLRPDLVERLVLVGATAGIEDEAARDERRRADEALAASIERDAADGAGLDRFIDRWLAGPLFATLPPEAAGRDERVASNTAEGLASSLRLAGTGTMEPLWGRLGELGRLELPVLVVAGALDEKFLALGQRLVDAIGARATLAVVPGAGHACHLEQPAAFLAAVVPFLHDRASPSA